LVEFITERVKTMKLKVLVDNNTLIDRYFEGEPGVSYYIEDGDSRILFDVGYSDLFIKNGEKMGIDFFNLDYLVLSHSHLDHTWGLEPYVKRLTEEVMEGRSLPRAKLVAHPGVFNSRTFTGEDELGITMDQSRLEKFFEFNLSREALWLTDRLAFLGEIPRKNDFESQSPIGRVLIDGVYEDDYNIDDSALVYKSDEGLVIITGCSHAGICNIIEAARALTGEMKIRDVIGGFHLQNPSERVLNKTVSYFKDLGTEKIHPCHCTDLRSKIALAGVVELGEVGVAFEISY
jgi:7,8-dihydropterin-6-yl-methyl-4-(beta-D-ribofuranosyl)aminobenzene 5'-phosphate synthase